MGRAYVLVDLLAPIGKTTAGELFARARGYPIANREDILEVQKVLG